MPILDHIHIYIYTYRYIDIYLYIYMIAEKNTFCDKTTYQLLHINTCFHFHTNLFLSCLQSSHTLESLSFTYCLFFSRPRCNCERAWSCVNCVYSHIQFYKTRSHVKGSFRIFTVKANASQPSACFFPPSLYGVESSLCAQIMFTRCAVCPLIMWQIIVCQIIFLHSEWVSMHVIGMSSYCFHFVCITPSYLW